MRDEEIYGLVGELIKDIAEALKDAVEENPEIVSRKKELKRYGIEIEIRIDSKVGLTLWDHKKSPAYFDLDKNENWKKWLRGKGIKWN